MKTQTIISSGVGSPKNPPTSAPTKESPERLRLKSIGILPSISAGMAELSPVQKAPNF